MSAEQVVVRAAPRADRVVLLGWEGADWGHVSTLLEAGDMPHLARLLERGVLGQIASLRPIHTPITWTSIATGKRPDRHGILGALEPTRDGSAVQWAGSVSRKVLAAWNMASLAGLSSTVVNWPASHPAEPIRGAVVTDRFALPGPQDGPWALAPSSVHPAELASELAALRIHWRDIGAAELRPFLRHANEIDQSQLAYARKLKALSRIIARTATVHAAATHLVTKQATALIAVRYDTVGACWSAFGDTRAAWTGAPDDHARSRHFSGVLDQAYRFHDQMLGRWVELAGPDALVIVFSDCGCREAGETTGGAHGQEDDLGGYYGFVAMAGPGVCRDERIYGCTLLDLAPTVLFSMGLPIGDDMGGAAWVGAFVSPPPVRRIPSWETVAGDGGRHPPDRETVSIGVRAAAHVRGRPGEAQLDARALATTLAREGRVRLAIGALDAGRTAEAMRLFEDLHRDAPESDALAELLCGTYLDAGQVDLAKPLVARLLARHATSPAAHLLAARLHLADRQPLAATDALRAAERLGPPPAVAGRLGRAYASLGFHGDAEHCFEAAVAQAPDDVSALEGLARCRLRAGRADLAVELLRRAVTRRHYVPGNHVLLGVAYARLGDWGRARAALETALRLRPALIRAYKLLAWVLGRLGEVERAERLFDLARRLRRAGRREPAPADPRGTASAVVVVTGLPRSGTSLAMQMLEAGGMPCLTDGLRAADSDNPRGYYELELVRALRHRSAWFADARGSALKVAHTQLLDLPARVPIRILHVTRSTDAVLASHRVTCERRGDPVPEPSWADQLNSALARVREATRERAEISWLEVGYDELVDEPLAAAARIRAFTGLPLDLARMAVAADPTLRHHGEHRARPR